MNQSMVVLQQMFEAVGTSTTLFTLDGSSSFPAINNKFVNCFFWNGDTGLLIGDGTNSYVQGISVSNCIFVGPLTCVKWYQGTGYLADSLIITGCQFGGSNTHIDISNILHPQITGCYFLNNLYMLKKDTPNDGTISGNVFFANGGKDYGIIVSGTQGTGDFQLQATLSLALII